MQRLTLWLNVIGAELWYIVNGKEKDDFSSAAREYALDHFHVKIDRFITPEDRTKVKTTISVTEANFFDVKPIDAQGFEIGDFFESPKFFESSKKIIRQSLKQIPSANHNSLKFLDLIRQHDSVAVHIRREDFIRVRSDTLLPISYYIKAMLYMRDKLKSPHFFIFSDDPSFCRSIFANLADSTVVSDPNNSSLDEFYMMRECKHIIASNSTFGWWASWLNSNPNKIVIMPKPFFTDSYFKRAHNNTDQKVKLYTQEIYLNGWITINPFKL